MWRRALLAAVAVSCTLPTRAHAHSTPRLTQIQDLICVLIMSGMQKEDLDVSMLRKLQRYNVNIDDINNDRIKQQCNSRTNGFTAEELRVPIKESYVSTTENKTEINTKDPLLSVDMNLDSVIDYLKNQKDSVENFDETTTTATTVTTTTEKSTDRPREIITSITEHVENPPKIDMEILRRYIQLETQKKSFYKLDENAETSKHHRTIKLKTNEGISNTADVGIINKLIKDYIFKKQKRPITTECTTIKHTIDIQSIYKQIDKIMEKQENINKDEMLRNKQDKDGENKFDVIKSIQVMPLGPTNTNAAENPLLESFYNFLTQMNQFKNNMSKPLNINVDNIHIKGNTQTTELLEPPNQNNEDKHNETTTVKSESDVGQKTLTPSLVKEIAETVKEVIIKDLRNELTNINFKTTQITTTIIPTTRHTTTEIPSTTTQNNTMQEKDMIIMDKFMDLYEEIKSLKQASFKLRAYNNTAKWFNDFKQPKMARIQNALTTSMANKFHTEEIKKPVMSVVNINPLPNYNTYIPRKKINHRPPITIQTNSIEIQPLAIPVLKPESMIRQNIIVHPTHRIQGREDLYVRPSGRTGNRYSDSDVPISYRNRTYNYKPLKRYDGYNSARYPLYNLKDPEQREDVIKFKMRDNGNSRLDTDYYEKINFGNDHNGGTGNGNGGNGNGNGGYVNGNGGYVNGNGGYVNGNGGYGNGNGGNGDGNGRYGNGIGGNSNGIGGNGNGSEGNGNSNRGNNGSAGIYISRYIPKFHERLERVDMAGKREYRDFPSRHQLSLVDMKKGSSYDDTHFKNFINTQQKVTDMLERILASRPKTNTPRSVEAV